MLPWKWILKEGFPAFVFTLLVWVAVVNWPS